MRSDRRNFLQGSATAAFVGMALPQAGHAQDGSLTHEMGRRLKYLTPPNGSPPDLLSRPSPPLTPFQPLTLEEIAPPVGHPLFEVTEAEAAGLDDSEWWDLFRKKFIAAAKVLRTDGFIVPSNWAVRGDEIVPINGTDRVRIDIGDPPDPESHQRFFEYRTRKFYINREVEFRWKFHPQYGEDCWSWGYHNVYWDEASGAFHATRACSPGTTFHARYGEPIIVRRINDLPEIGANEGHSRLRFALPSTTSHLHNAHTATESDGYPSDWINPGETWDHHYANFPSGNDEREKLSTLWYHDHRMDFTASNVYAGLDGFYLLFDDDDANDETKGWRLPSGEFDIPLIFHDLLFAQEVDGEAVSFPREETTRLTFESKQDWDDFSGTDRGDVLADGTRKAIKYKAADTGYDPSPQIIFDGFNTEGIIGDRWTVNRRIQPKLTVKPRKYRLRLLNGGPSRFYEFFLHAQGAPSDAYRVYTEEDGDAGPTQELDHPFIVICGDGNFQPNPVLAHSIYLGVAQRVDVIIDFSKYAGSTVYLVNRLEQEHGRGPSERKIDPTDYASNDDFYKANAFMALEVEDMPADVTAVNYGMPVPADYDPSAFPLLFREFPSVDFTEVKRERQWEFDYDGGMWTINGDVFDPNRVDAGIEQDSAEIWTFRNGGNGWHHPIHSHFTEFIIIERDSQPFLRGTIQTQPFVQNSSLLAQTELPAAEGQESMTSGPASQRLSGSFVTRGGLNRTLSDIFKAPDSGTEEAAPNNAEMSREDLNQRIRENLPKFDVPTGPAITAVDEALDQLEPPARSELKAALGRGAFDRLTFRSYDYFALWVKILPLLGLGHPKVDRFLGGARRDVALLLPNTEVTVFARWKDFMGKHVMHCHNVVHEDHAMMIRWDIVPKGEGFDVPQMSDEIAQTLGDPVKPHRREHIEIHPAGGAHQPDDS